MYFIPGLDENDENKKYEPLGSCNSQGIIVRDDANVNTLAHEIGHACGLYDIYYWKENVDWSELLAAVKQNWASSDWNNGTGSRFYGAATSQADLIKRLLMLGEGSDIKSDIPLGNVYGISEFLTKNNMNVGRIGMTIFPPRSH